MDAAKTLRAAKDLFARAARPNVFIKIPDTAQSLPAVEEAIFAGIPVNMTLLFSRAPFAGRRGLRGGTWALRRRGGRRECAGFFRQIPHFLAIAMFRREDYRAAGPPAALLGALMLGWGGVDLVRSGWLHLGEQGITARLLGAYEALNARDRFNF